MIFAFSILAAIIGTVLAFVGLRSSHPPKTGIGIGLLVLAMIPMLVLPALNKVKQGEQAIDEQWRLVREAIPEWNVQNLLVMHHAEQEKQARGIGGAVANASYAVMQDPLSMDITDVAQVEFRVLATEFAEVLKQHPDADLVVVMPGLPGGLATVRPPKSQRLVIADLGSGQWQKWARHPNVFAGVLSGDRESPGWRIETKKK